MKTIRNLIYYASVGLTALLAASCVEEQIEPAEQPDGAQVFFPIETPTEYNIDEKVESITFPVKRAVTEGEMTVEVLVDNASLVEAEADGLFTFPSSVTFKDGEDEAEFIVTFIREDLEDGEEYSFGLLLNDEENSTPYGNRTLYVTVAPWPWTYLGEGKYRDDFFAFFEDTSTPEIKCRIHEHKTKKGLYMLENLFSHDLLYEVFGASSDEEKEGITSQFPYTPTNITVDCTNPDQVTLPQQYTGIEEVGIGMSKIVIQSDPEQPGTLKDGVIKFPQKGLVIIGTGNPQQYSFYANTKGMFRILLPGAEDVDYALSASYAGMRVSADNTTASAVIDFAYGADVTGIKYVFADGDLTGDAAGLAELVNGVADGTAENIYEVDEFVAGGEKVSVEAELEAGSYTVVALPVDKAGKPDADYASAAWFYFPGTGGGAQTCEFEVNMHKVSEYDDAADLVAQYPDHSSLLYEFIGKDIKSVRIYLNETSVVESAPSMGLTFEDILKEYGKDISADALTELNETGKYWSIYYNLDPDTEYTLLVDAMNDFGQKVFKRADFRTAQIPYSGELVIGNYTMSYMAETTTGESVECKTVLKVSPTENSTEKFKVSNLLDGDGISWLAKYDAAAKTLTLDGTSDSFVDQNGNPVEGNFFDQFLLLTETEAVAYFSYTDPEGAADVPLVFTVDDSKRLSGLNTNLEIAVGVVSGNQVASTQTVAVYLAGETMITYTEEAQASRMEAAPCFMLSSDFRFTAGKVSGYGIRPFGAKYLERETVRPSAGVKTIEVKTSVCEPLPFGGVKLDFTFKK